MPLEIERKFLVKGDFKQFAHKQERIVQAYISDNPEHSVRIRLKGENAFLTIKGKSSKDGLVRIEWEKEISLSDFDELFKLCIPDNQIDKTRYYIKAEELTFEVDEFYGKNEGLFVAEIELPDEKTTFEKPDWLGKEVTGDTRYYNSQLSKHPYTKWKDDK